MKNQQPPEVRASGNGEFLELIEIFPTIQGEGPFAGAPAVFIRLAGCNLRCPHCDTQYTEGRRTVSVAEIINEVLIHHIPLVVITGGEPFRQNLTPLIRELRVILRRVQIETNGKMAPADTALLCLTTVVVSPKTATIDPHLASLAAAYKYVISHDDVAEDGLPVSALGHPLPQGKTVARPPEDYRGPIFIQPMDAYDPVENNLNMQAAVSAVMRNPRRHKLCLQMHKYAELP